jgi:dienelactone hydrolase
MYVTLQTLIVTAELTSGVVFSEIYQVTGPVERFASNIASEGYVVALPSSFHEFEGPEAIPYDTDGTDRGNKYKVSPHYQASYDTNVHRLRRPWKHTMRMQHYR